MTEYSGVVATPVADSSGVVATPLVVPSSVPPPLTSMVETSPILPPSIFVPDDVTSLAVSSLCVAAISATFQCPLRATRVLGDGCDSDDFAWQKAASLVEDGWTTIKGKKVKFSTPTFDMALRSQKMGPKGKS